jgi:hypothetical protein
VVSVNDYHKQAIHHSDVQGDLHKGPKDKHTPKLQLNMHRLEVTHSLRE